MGFASTGCRPWLLFICICIGHVSSKILTVIKAVKTKTHSCIKLIIFFFIIGRWWRRSCLIFFRFQIFEHNGCLCLSSFQINQLLQRRQQGITMTTGSIHQYVRFFNNTGYTIALVSHHGFIRITGTLFELTGKTQTTCTQSLLAITTTTPTNKATAIIKIVVSGKCVCAIIIGIKVTTEPRMITAFLTFGARSWTQRAIRIVIPCLFVFALVAITSYG
mmetsp:Transcript_31167/g.46012  ORF Transcript_31167/g.46012 Transcript_31167/m.46012 type:complete len:219 (-) Transcript_31167:1075-1731(-)